MKVLRAIAVMVLAVATLHTTSPAWAGATADTPASLAAAAARDAASARRGFATAVQIYDAIGRRKGFSASVLKAAQSNDREGLARLFALASGAPVDSVAIDEVDRDILIKGTIIVGHGKDQTVITYCLDTEGKRCGGHGYSIGIAGA